MNTNTRLAGMSFGGSVGPTENLASTTFFSLGKAGGGTQSTLISGQLHRRKSTHRKAQTGAL